MQNFLLIILFAALTGVAATSGYLYFALRNPDKSKEIKPLNTFWLAVVVMLFVVMVVAAFFCFVSAEFSISNNLGQVGDFIGGLTNPLLSFLALLVLLRTTLIQTSEAKKTTSFMARQQHIMEREKFENTFFQLVDRLDTYAEVLFRADVDKAKRYAYVLRQKLISKKQSFDAMSWKEGVDASAEHVREVISGDFDRLNGFGRKASLCLYFIDSANISLEEKEFYFKYFIEVFHQYEYSLFLTIIFLRSPDSVKIIKSNGLARTLRSDSLCSNHVYNLFSELDTSDVYPLLTHPEGNRRSSSLEVS